MKKLILLMLLLVFTGCAGTNIQTTGKALLVTEQTILGIHEAFRVPCSSGIVPAADCRQVDIIVNESKGVYDAAVDAAILGIQAGTTGGDAQAKQEAFTRLTTSLIAMAIKYSIGVPK